MTEVAIKEVNYRCERCSRYGTVLCSGEPHNSYVGFCEGCGHIVTFVKVEVIK